MDAGHRDVRKFTVLLYWQIWQLSPCGIPYEKCIHVIYVFWLNRFTHKLLFTHYHHKQTHRSILLHFFPLFKLISTSYGCPLHQSNDILPSSLPCRKDFLLFLLPLPGTGCTEYLWTETQRKKEGTLLIGSANMAWRTAQPSSASYSAPPVRMPSCSDTWPRKVNLSLWKDQPHDRFVCVYVCECVFVCWFQ